MDYDADQSDEQARSEAAVAAGADVTDVDGADPEADRQVNPRMRLYTLRVASNKEDRVKDALEIRKGG